MAEVGELLLFISVFALAALIGLLLLVLMTQGGIILYRKFSSKWVHCNKCDSWRKIEVEAGEQTEE